ncbi:MAG: OsmC family peroxiredoxin [Nocardioidaceae bacterium]
MPSRKASTRWTGDLMSGSGEVSLDTSGAARFTLTFPTRIGDASKETNPEELIAAAHATCFAQNFAGTLAKNDLTSESHEVRSTVTVNKVDDGLAITDIALELEATVPGVDNERFQELASLAERTCPVSKALAGTKITLTATLQT